MVHRPCAVARRPTEEVEVTVSGAGECTWPAALAVTTGIPVHRPLGREAKAVARSLTPHRPSVREAPLGDGPGAGRCRRGGLSVAAEETLPLRRREGRCRIQRSAKGGDCPVILSRLARAAAEVCPVDYRRIIVAGQGQAALRAADHPRVGGWAVEAARSRIARREFGLLPVDEM